MSAVPLDIEATVVGLDPDHPQARHNLQVLLTVTGRGGNCPV